MKTTLYFTLTLFTFLTIAFVPNSFAQDSASDYVVRVVYFIPNDQEPEPNIDEKLDTMIKDIQKYYADLMEAHGFKRKTFRFEADDNGNAIVHQITGKFDDASYQQYGGIWQEVEQRFDMSKRIYLCMYDGSGACLVSHGSDCRIVGLGGGNSQNGTALVLYQDVANEDRTVFSDNVAIHELGHAFGLSHDSRVNAIRREPFTDRDGMVPTFRAAEWLNAHRYFNDTKTPVNHNTTANMLTPVLGSPWYQIRFRFEITDPDGLYQAHLFAPHLDSVIAFQRLDENPTQTIEIPTHEWAGGSFFSLTVMDVYGNFMAFNFTVDVSSLLPDPEAIVIPDPNLAAAVRRTLNILEEDDITQLDMLKIKSLQAFQSQITDITGLEHALKLESATFSDNNIQDVTPLAGLPHLRNLTLRYNPIRDVTPLQRCPVLEHLNIHRTQVRDMKSLAGMTQLNLLVLSENQLVDITPLAALTDLEHLYLNDNSIRNITPLSSLKKLKKLELLGNQVSDITALSSLTELESLDLRSNPVSDITALSSLKKLKKLELWRNQVTDITPLASLTALEHLDLSDNPIRDVSSLEGLVNLNVLKLMGNPIKNRKPLFALLRNNPDIKIYLKNIWEPLPVSLSSFKAVQTADGAVLQWTTESEVENAGFYIYRSQSKDGEFKVVNPTMLQGAGTTGERTEYTWTDTTAKPNTVYYYQIEDVSHAGERKRLATVRLRGLVSARGKLMTKWANLK